MGHFNYLSHTSSLKLPQHPLCFFLLVMREPQIKKKKNLSSLISYKPLLYHISLARDLQLMRILLPGDWFL